LFNPGSTKPPFEIPLKEIKGCTIRREEYHDKVRKELCLSTEDGKIARLHAQDTRGLKTAIEEEMKNLGVSL
jgi:hypothetical protein